MTALILYRVSSYFTLGYTTTCGHYLTPNIVCDFKYNRFIEPDSGWQDLITDIMPQRRLIKITNMRCNIRQTITISRLGHH